MSIVKKILFALVTTTLVFQLAGCGQQRPAGGGTTQQKADTAKDTTTQPPQDTTQDTTKDTTKDTAQ